MSKTDNTRPIELQWGDESRSGYIRHDHFRERREYELVTVSWGELCERYADNMYLSHWGSTLEIIMRYFTGEFEARELLYMALFGQPRKARYDIFEDTSDIKNLRFMLSRFLVERTVIDPGDEFTDDTIVGYRKIWRIFIEEVACDYNPDNWVHNRRLRQKLGSHEAWDSDEWRHCVRYADHEGGSRSYSGRGAVYRRKLTRTARYEAKRVLRQAVKEGIGADFEPEPYRPRHRAYWLSS